jgi:chromosome segregation ATPase
MIFLDFFSTLTIGDALQAIVIVATIILAYGNLKAEINLMKKDIDQLRREDVKLNARLDVLEEKIDNIQSDITELKVSIAKLR